MNLPNKLTLSRIILLPFFLFCLLYGLMHDNPTVVLVMLVLALIIYIAAAITDLVDGKIARRRNLETNFGKLFDPLADKMLNCSALVALVELHLIPGWIVILILAREFMVTGLRSLAMSQNRVIAADKWGKSKTASQVTAIIYGICYLIVADILEMNLLNIPENYGAVFLQWALYIFYIILAVCVAYTVGSGWNYLAKNWDLVTDHE